MRKLILEEWISLDGYAADRNGTTDFFPSTEMNRDSAEDQPKFLDSIDTILLGRKTYEVFADFWPTEKSKKEIIADKLNSLHKIVFSSTLKKAPWGRWPEADVVSADAIQAIRKLKQEKGKDVVLFGKSQVLE